MKNYIISTSDFEHFESRTRIAGQHGKGVNKSLDMFVYPLQKRIWFVVENQRKVVAEVPDLEDAIKLFNEI